MLPVRIFFTKTGNAKYLSHLDVNRAMQRALRRSGLPIWFTEGFNPHIYINFATPLPLGVESLYEILDFRLTDEVEHNNVKKRLNAVLPDGLHVENVSDPKSGYEKIHSANYEIFLSGGLLSSELYVCLNDFFSQETIIVSKKSGNSTKKLDLRTHIGTPIIELKKDGVMIFARLPSGIQLNISPILLLSAFQQNYEIAPETVSIVKTAIYDQYDKLFL